MRDRCKELREQRENERRQLAAQKKRQQFLSMSEPIRKLQQKKQLEVIIRHTILHEITVYLPLTLPT